MLAKILAILHSFLFFCCNISFFNAPLSFSVWCEYSPEICHLSYDFVSSDLLLFSFRYFYFSSLDALTPKIKSCLLNKKNRLGLSSELILTSDIIALSAEAEMFKTQPCAIGLFVMDADQAAKPSATALSLYPSAPSVCY